MDGRARRRCLGTLGDVGEDLLRRTRLVVHHAQTALPPALVLLIRELNHVAQRLLRALCLVLVEAQGTVLRGQLQQGRRIAGIATLAVVVLVQAAGVHLEDDEVLERCVGQGRFIGDVADALR